MELIKHKDKQYSKEANEDKEKKGQYEKRKRRKK